MMRARPTHDVIADAPKALGRDDRHLDKDRKETECPCHPPGPRRHQEAAVYHIVAADSRAPRDGRFIERLGYFNPLLPKDKQERLKLDLDKVKAWMEKGAQPSDRVMRFLDAAGVVKRDKRNNPEKAVPRKERKAKAEEAARQAEAARPRPPPRRPRLPKPPRPPGRSRQGRAAGAPAS